MLWHNKLFDEKHDYMRNMQTILWAMVLCLLCSCSDRGDDISGRRYPILFGSTDTRAVADITDLQDNGFKVYAYFEGSLNNASFEKEVTYNYDNDVWGYDGVQYWIPSTKYWFTAFYPTTPTAGTVTVTAQESNYHSYTITNFDITKQEDIMVAQAYREVGANAGAPTEGSVVKLNFQHLLACVVVKIKAEIKVTIEKVSLLDTPVKCNYIDDSWELITENDIVQDEINVSLLSDSDPAEITFLVFPQDVNGVQLSVDTSDKDYKVAIPTTPATWVKGTKYTYTMTIKQDFIEFNEPSVEVWDEENATGSVVIK